MMAWRLFLDDDADTVRQPSICVENPEWRAGRMLAAKIPDTAHLGDWVIARSCDEAFFEIDKRGLPTFVSFDHDLCDEREGYDGKKVAEYIVAKDMRERSLPENFSYEVHSWNGRGAIRIQSYLDCYLSSDRSGKPVITADDDMAAYYERLFKNS